jgi:hypothetical protein
VTTNPPVRTVEIAAAYRRHFDEHTPGWRGRLRQQPGKPLMRLVVVAKLAGVPGLREAVLYVRGGLDGEALPDEVVEFDPRTMAEGKDGGP